MLDFSGIGVGGCVLKYTHALITSMEKKLSVNFPVNNADNFARL